MKRKKLFDRVSDMEPMLPEDRDGKLASLGLGVIRRAEQLRAALHPITRRGVADLVRSMNSYYSNLIEGHRTTPRDIDAALRKEFSRETKHRQLQQLHWAHVETQRKVSDEELATINLTPLRFHGEWNYIIHPRADNKL